MRSASQSKIRSEKVVLIGAPSSGKSSLENRFINNNFVPNQEATIGAAFNSKVLKIDESEIKIDIWDTGGSEKYRSLVPMYFRDAKAAIVVFDITSEQSFTEASDWIAEFRERGMPNSLIFGAANKIDLASDRKIKGDKIKEFAENHQLNFIIETSALTGEGVNELFNELGRQLMIQPAPKDPITSGDVDIADPIPTQKGCSC